MNHKYFPKKTAFNNQNRPSNIRVIDAVYGLNGKSYRLNGTSLEYIHYFCSNTCG